MISNSRIKVLFIFLALYVVSCTPTKKPIEFEFEKSYIDVGYYQGFNYAGINIFRNGKSYNYSFGDFKDFANSIEVIEVNDLDGDNEIDLLLKLSACGANCSGHYQVLYYDPELDKYISTEPLARSKITPIDYRNGNSSKKLYVTREDSLISKFSNPISSIGPIQILEYTDNRFHDITNEYIQIVEEDAAYWEARIRNVDIYMTEEYTKFTGIRNFKEREVYDTENESSLHVLYYVSYVSDMCLIEKCEKGWDTYNKYCAEDKYLSTETCKRFEESIKLALETREVLK
jgi:hypothetical protein